MVKQLYVELVALTDSYKKSIDVAYTKLEEFGDKTQKVGKALTAGVTLPLIALGFTSVKAASDLEESMNKVDVAFKTSAMEVKKFADQSLNAYGISKGNALEMASLFGDMATSMGLPTDKAALMSTALVGLTADMASFKNVSNEVASNALKGIFTGEGESLKSLGIVMQDSTLKAYALSKGVKVSYEDMDQASKVSLRYAFVMDAAKNAQGDFARTAGGAANQMRSFPQVLDEIRTSFGEFILPMFTEGITKINGLLKAFNSLDADVKKNILMGAVFAAAIGPTLIIVGTLISSVKTIGLAFAALNAPIIGAIALVGAFAYGASENFATLKNNLKVLNREFYHFEKGLVSLLRLVNGDQWTDARLQKMLDEFVDRSEAIDNIGFGKKVFEKFNEGSKLAKLNIDDLLKNLKGGAGGGKGAGKGSAIHDYTMEIALLNDEIAKGTANIQHMWEDISRLQARAISGDVKAIMPTMSRTADMGAKDKGLIESLFGDDLAKSTANLQARLETLKAGIQPVITDFTSQLGDFIKKNFETIQTSMGMGIEFLGDTLATGLASIFNKNIKFDFSKMLGGFLSSLGDMFLKMATPMIIGGLLMNIGLPGSGTAQLGSGLKLGALAVGLKAGGMALSASSSNAMVSNNASNGPSYNNSSPSFGGWQSQKIDIKVTGELKGQGTELIGVFNNTQRVHNG